MQTKALNCLFYGCLNELTTTSNFVIMICCDLLLRYRNKEQKPTVLLFSFIKSIVHNPYITIIFWGLIIQTFTDVLDGIHDIIWGGEVMKYFGGRYIIKFMYLILENGQQSDTEENSFSIIYKISWTRRLVTVFAYWWLWSSRSKPLKVNCRIIL